MGKIIVFLFDGITDYEITFVTHLLKADANLICASPHSQQIAQK